MKKWIFSLSVLSLIILSVDGFVSARAKEKEKAVIKYKKGKKINFESLLIEGEQKKPEMSVVFHLAVGRQAQAMFKLFQLQCQVECVRLPSVLITYQ